MVFYSLSGARPSTGRLADDAPLAASGSWPARQPPSLATRALEAQAPRTIRAIIKGRARDYLDERWQLDLLRHGFPASTYTPQQLVEFAKEVLRQEFLLRFPPDHRGEFVPVKKINAKAAILAGRYLRAKERLP